MANLQRFNRQHLAELRERARTSLFFFQRALWNDRDLDPDVHRDLCDFLQGTGAHEPWTRAVVCGFRGSLKSSSGRAWMAWKALYGAAAGLPLEDVARYLREREIPGIEAKPGVAIPDWSCLLVEQRYENAEAHHEMMQSKFRWGPQAALLQDLYRDRLPEGFADWNKGRTVMRRTDPNAEPSLVAAGLDSKLESMHKDAIVCDDLEGADADKSDVPNADSWKFVIDRATPLLREPAHGQVLVLGTPHGDKPVVWRLRRLEAEGSLDNRRRPEWKVWWREVVDPSTGESRWPKRFTPGWIRQMQAKTAKSPEIRRLWDRQYMLKEETEAGRMFDMDIIASRAYELEGAFRIRYRTDVWDPKKLDEEGWLMGREKVNHTDLSQLRFFMHLDAKHRDPNDHKPGVRPSLAAIVVTGVSPDLHIFVVDTWIKEAGLDEFSEQFFFLYRKWAPYKFTMDTVGAQIWFKSFLRILETGKYRNCMSLARPWRPARRLPRPSSLLVEAHKANRGKEEYIIQQLEVPTNLGFLHLNRAHEELWRQFEAFPSANYPADGVDALSQGPIVWERFIGRTQIAALRRKHDLVQQYRMVEPITGYVRGFPVGQEGALAPN